MFIKYDEDELTKLFKAKPVFIYEREAGMFIYSFSDNKGGKITLSISIYEKEVFLLLCHNEKVIKEEKLEMVEDLSCENNCLRIHQGNVSHDIVVQLEPEIIVRYPAS